MVVELEPGAQLLLREVIMHSAQKPDALEGGEAHQDVGVTGAHALVLISGEDSWGASLQAMAVFELSRRKMLAFRDIWVSMAYFGPFRRQFSRRIPTSRHSDPPLRSSALHLGVVMGEVELSKTPRSAPGHLFVFAVYGKDSRVPTLMKFTAASRPTEVITCGTYPSPLALPSFA